MSLMVAFGLATDIGALLWKSILLSSSAAEVDRWSFNIFSGITIGTFLLGLWQAHAGPWVRRVDVPIRNLPAAFDGFAIAQVSDLHVGPTIKGGYTRKVVNIVNGLKADIIALTGDFIDGTVENLAPHLAPLKDLQAKDGVFFVTGNHDTTGTPMHGRRSSSASARAYWRTSTKSSGAGTIASFLQA